VAGYSTPCYAGTVDFAGRYASRVREEDTDGRQPRPVLYEGLACWTR